MPVDAPLFKVRNEFEIEGGRWIIASLSLRGTPSEMFDALLGGHEVWSTAKRSEFSKLDVTVSVRSRDPAHEELLRYLIDRWNTTKKPKSPGRVELWMGSNEQSFYGFTNGTFPDVASKRTQTVRYTTYEEMEAALSGEVQAIEERERARRRANPVRDPIKLPRGIAGELARYLRLEYAELEIAKFGARKLRLIGEILVDGVPTQYWAVEAALGEPMWGVVERFDDYYLLSSTSNLPNELRANEG